MPNVHLQRNDPPGEGWRVQIDDGPAERFTCPVEALLRAKSLYEHILPCGRAALLVDFDGHQETRLLPR